MYTKEQKDRALSIYDVTQSIAEVIRQLGWYREKRIKLSLHGLNPVEYRRKLGLI